MKNLRLIIPFLSIVFLGCEKEELEPKNVTAEITITEPSLNDTIMFNEEMHFEGTIQGSAELHGYQVWFVNATTDSVLYNQVYDVHADSYNFHEHWVNTVSDTSLVKLKIDVTKDHEGNHETKEINVICLPQ